MKKAAFLLVVLVVASGCERWRHEFAHPAPKDVTSDSPEIKYTFEFPKGTNGIAESGSVTAPEGPMPLVDGGSYVQ